MQLLLDFPTIGEPHYAESFPASLIKDKQVKFYKLEENNHPHALKGIKDARVERKGNEVHIYLTSIRSNFRPDNIEGVRVGDEVYFHMTNLEQDWDVPHGLALSKAPTPRRLLDHAG
jgi:nitrous-oxide reductase